jgi:hypothetical protein
MPEPEIMSDEEFERFDEAQPFLQLIADLLNRIVHKNTKPDTETESASEHSFGSPDRSDS